MKVFFYNLFILNPKTLFEMPNKAYYPQLYISSSIGKFIG